MKRVLLIAPNTPGLASEGLVKFLRERPDSYYLDTVLHPVAPVPTSRISEVLGRRLWREPIHLGLVSYLIDFLITLAWVAFRRPYDSAILITPHLALAGLVLRALGKVKRVTYWSLDYYPVRYGRSGGIARVRLGALLEKVYRQVEKLVVRRVDERWHVTKVMLSGWKQGGYTWQGPTIHVPHPVLFLSPPSPRSGVVIWSGTSRGGSGIELLAKAWPLVLERGRGLSLLITRRTPLLSDLPEVAALLEMDGVQDLGFVKELSAFHALVRTSAAGIAVYDSAGYKRFSDASRVKLYLAHCTPIIASGTSEICEDVESFCAGEVIGYEPLELSEAICHMAGNYAAYQPGVRKMAEKYLYSNVFSGVV